MTLAAPAGTAFRRLTLVAPAVLLAVLAWDHRWMSDDGFINLRVVDMLRNGHGPVFNAGERVEVFTSPLWVLVLTAGDVVTPLRLEWLAVAVGIAATTGGLLLACIGAARLSGALSPSRSPAVLVPAGAAVVVAVAVMWDYSTSGLETSLTFLWLGLSAALLGTWAAGGRFGLAAAVVLGLGPLVRPDLGVFSILFVGAVLLVDRDDHTWKRRAAIVGAAAAAPFAYQLFRMGYYAALVPTTALAKEAGRSRWDAGWLYVRDFFGAYWLLLPLLLLLITVYVPIALVARRDAPAHTAARIIGVLTAFAMGAVLHALYVARVGGDFMHGRMLLPALFAVCAPVAVVPARRELAGTVGIGAWAVVALFFLRPPTEPSTIETSFVADVHAAAVDDAGTEHPVTTDDFGWGDGGPRRSRYTEPSGVWSEGRPVTGDAAPGLHTPAVANFGIGIVSYSLGHDWYVLDLLGLGDALTGRLDVDQPGLVGHEKPLPQPWIVARTVAEDGSYDADAIPTPSITRPLVVTPPGELDAQADEARTALACAPLVDLDRAISAELTVSRFLSNVADAWSLTRLRVPPEPAVAVDELC
jgi:arabinofuranosyltransferase